MLESRIVEKIITDNNGIIYCYDTTLVLQSISVFSIFY